MMNKEVNKEPELTPLIGIILTVCAALSVWLLLGEVERKNKIVERLVWHCVEQENTPFDMDAVCQGETINYVVNGE